MEAGLDPIGATPPAHFRTRTGVFLEGHYFLHGIDIVLLLAV